MTLSEGRNSFSEGRRFESRWRRTMTDQRLLLALLLILSLFLLPSVQTQVKDAPCNTKMAVLETQIAATEQAFRCQSGCASGAGGGSSGVFGTSIYHVDSIACLAAIHDGAIDDAAGGVFLVTLVSGLASYSGSEKNGVNSSDGVGNVSAGDRAAFLARPFTAKAVSVKETETKVELTVEKPDAYEQSFDSYRLYMLEPGADLTSTVVANLTKFCEKQKSSNLSCDMTNANSVAPLHAGTPYRVVVLSWKTWENYTFFSESVTTPALTRPLPVTDIVSLRDSDSRLNLTFEWNPANAAALPTSDAVFVGILDKKYLPDNTTANKIVFDGLEGGTEYDLGVFVRVLDPASGLQRKSNDLMIPQITKPSTPTVSNVSSPRVDALIVNWSSPSDRFNEVVVSYKEESETDFGPKVFPKNQFSIELSGLIPARVYQVFVETRIDWNGSPGVPISSSSSNVSMHPTKPPMPNVTSKATTSSSFRLTWDWIPTPRGSEKWRVRCLDETGAVVHNNETSEKFVNVTGLSPGRIHNCTVVTLFEGTESDAAFADQVLTLPGKAFLSPLIPDVDSFLVRFARPLDGLVDGFQIRYKNFSDANYDAGLTLIVNGSDQTKRLIDVGVDAGRRFLVELRTKNSAGISDVFVEGEVFTKPRAARDLRVAPSTSSTLELRWKAPVGEFGSFEVTGPSNVANSVARNDSLDDYFIVFENLTSGTLFSFSIVAIVNGTLEGAAETISAWTLPGQVQELAASEIDTYSFKVSWAPIAGAVTVFRVFLSNASSPDDWRQFLEVSQSPAPLTGLVAGTRHRIRVVAVRDADVSDLFATIWQSTTPVAPESIEVTILSSSSLAASWTAPAEGGVESYELRINGTDPRTFAPNVTAFVFDGLTPGTEYGVTVVASFDGLVSGATVTANSTLPGNVTALTIFEAKVDGLIVTWKTPPGGRVSSYGVRYRKIGETIWVDSPEVTDERTILSGLDPGTDYEIEVTAILDGRRSDGVVVMEAATLPDAGVVRVIDYGVDFATVSVRGPTKGGYDAFNLSFGLESGKADEYMTLTLSPDGNGSATFNTSKFGALVPGESYLFLLRVLRSSLVSSSSSTVQRLRPLPVQLVVLSDVSTDALNVSWRRPSSGVVSGFEVAHCRLDDCPATQTISSVGADEARKALTGLTPGRRYSVVVTSVSGSQKGDAIGAEETLFPSAPVSTSVTDLPGLLRILVEWVAPTDSFVEGFRVSVGAVERNASEFNSSASFDLPADAFQPGNLIDVFVVTVAGDKIGAAARKTHLLKPDVVDGLNEVSAGSAEIELEWKPPAAGRASKYSIQWVSSDAGTAPQTRLISAPSSAADPVRYTIKDSLSAATRYNVSVSVVVEDAGLTSTGHASSISVRTDPGVVGGVDVRKSTTEANVTWHKPATTTLSFDHYVVSLYRDNDSLLLQSINSSYGDESARFFNLTPGALHRLVIAAAFADVHQTGESSALTFRTYPAPIEDIVAEVAGQNVTLIWTPPPGERRAVLIQCLVAARTGPMEDPLGFERNCNDREAPAMASTVVFELMRPAAEFRFVILVESDAAIELLKSTTFEKKARTPAGTPLTPRDGEKPVVKSADATAPSLMVDCGWFPSNYGAMTRFTVLGSTQQTMPRELVLNWATASRLPNWPTYQLFKRRGCGASRRRAAVAGNVSVSVGNEICDSTAPDGEFCNGALRPGSQFYFLLRGFVSDAADSPFADTTVSEPVSTPPSVVVLEPLNDKTTSSNVAFAVKLVDRYFKSLVVKLADESGTELRTETFKMADFPNDTNRREFPDFSPRPLNADAKYVVSAFAVSDFNVRGGEAQINVSTTAPETIAIVVGVIVAVLVVVLLVAGYVIVRRRKELPKLPFAKRRDDINSHITVLDATTMRTGATFDLRPMRAPTPEEKITSMPVKIDRFVAYVEDLHRDSDMKFASQYEDLKMVGREQSVEFALLTENKPKNRFTNILPYDHSRVKLLPVDDDEASDYINANYMPGYNSPREYVVTQGPLPGTSQDFWRMVWEQNVQAIVMLTKCQEKGREKCFQYWPLETQTPRVYGELEITSLSMQTTNDWTTTQMNIDLGDVESRKLVHFHYTAWPDFGVPREPSSLVAFVRTVRGRCKSRGGPILVHCSAGVGRSGTFIGLDWALQRIVEHDDVDLYGTVHRMRRNRTFMVQTESQYIFLHQCVAHVLEWEEEEERRNGYYANVNFAFEADEGIVDSRV